MIVLLGPYHSKLPVSNVQKEMPLLEHVPKAGYWRHYYEEPPWCCLRKCARCPKGDRPAPRSAANLRASGFALQNETPIAEDSSRNLKHGPCFVSSLHTWNRRPSCRMVEYMNVIIGWITDNFVLLLMIGSMNGATRKLRSKCLSNTDYLVVHGIK